MERDSLLPLPSSELVEFHPAIRDLYCRRLGSAEAAAAFLSAPASTAPLPCDLVGVREAVDRIEAALDSRERIAVFGHDDPDGITSAAIVIEVLELLGGEVESYIPNRVVEGHGLYPDLIRKFAGRGVRLLITTDGCTTNREEADLAAELGMDVIVTDHHEVAGGRSTVPCLVNPKARPGRTDCTDLTGAGVAALVMRELLHRRPDPDAASEPALPIESPEDPGADESRPTPPDDLPPECSDNRFFRLLDLVALGTIADYGDVGRNNRAMVVRGLTAVAQGARPAISLVRRALEIGPPAVLRFEKASRLAAVFAAIPSTDGASPGLDALLGRSTWAGDVDDLIRVFLRTEAEIDAGIATIEAAAKADEEAGEPLVVLVEDVAPRSLGRGATRLAERTGRPAAVLRPQGDQVVGELRGGDAGNLVELLGTLRDEFSSWGGHRQAAGFSAPLASADTIAQSLRAAFVEVPPTKAPSRCEAVPIRRGDIDSSFSRSLRAAMPFGRGNPVPVFAIMDYRSGGTLHEFDARDRVRALLHEPELPERPEGHVPMVIFHPRGSGGLAVEFQGWVEESEVPCN